jgi:hypothetical protein
VDEMSWDFRTLLGEIPILSFLATGSVMNIALRIFLTSLPINIACSDSCGNTNSVLFLHSSGYISSSSSESVCVGACFFYTSTPELGPTPPSYHVFFSSSAGRM